MSRKPIDLIKSLEKDMEELRKQLHTIGERLIAIERTSKDLSKSMKAYGKEIKNLYKKAEKIDILLLHAEDMGEYRAKRCRHVKNNYCMLWLWRKPPKSYGDYIMDEDGRYHIKVNPIRCVMCDEFEKPPEE